MRIVFFLGMTTDKNVQEKVETESLTFNDIVQGNFYDSYRNTTHKGVLWLRWVNENCASAETVLKIDDDVFVNTFQLAKRYKSLFSDIRSNMVCELLPKGTNIINRNNHAKWQVSRLEFKQYKYYPMNMCRGYFVHMTANVVREMYRAAQETRFFWIDDVYLFGILTEKVKANQSYLVDLVNETNQEDGFKCFQGFKRECKMLGFLVDENQHMHKLWASIR
jgi:beta-1,3-galactosyltransferase 1